MSIAPLFIKDRPTLLDSLRLTGTDESSGQQIDDAILEARQGIYEELGSERVTAIVGYTRSNTPSTTNELVRSKAETVERKWVRAILMRTMPTFFLQGSGQSQQVWNEEGLLRDADFRHEKEISRLMSEVHCGLQDLSTGTCSPNINVIGPTTTNPYPGSSVFPQPGDSNFVA